MNILLVCNYDDYELIPSIAKALTDLGNRVYFPYNYLYKQAKKETILEVSSSSFTLQSIYNELDNKKLNHTKNILAMEGNESVNAVVLVNTERESLDLCTLIELNYCFMCGCDVYLLNNIVTRGKNNSLEFNFSGVRSVKPLNGDIYNMFRIMKTKKR